MRKKMVQGFDKFFKNCDSKENSNLKRASLYDDFSKHGNEVSIILVITDQNLKIDHLTSNKRKKSRERSCGYAGEASESRDSLKFFNFICNQSNQKIENYEKLKKLFQNLQQARLKKFKNDEYGKKTPRKHKKNKKHSKEHNIYGPIRYIPTSYSRPSLPPFYKNKTLAQYCQNNDADSNVLTNFLYSKYDFEHSTPTCSSESEILFESFQREDSFELRPIYSSSDKICELNEKIQVGDRPNKNLEIKNKYFNVCESNLKVSLSISSSESIEDLENREDCQFPILRQNRIIFCDSNQQNDDHVKHEANLPKLPDEGSILTITKRFEFNSFSNDSSRKHVGKNNNGNRSKNLNQDQYNKLSDIAEEENFDSSYCSSKSLYDDKKIEKDSLDDLTDLNDMIEENSIQKDIDLASESFSSTTSSLKYFDDQITREFSNKPYYANDNFYPDIREKENFSFKKLYNNYFSLVDKKFTMSIPRPEIGSKENLVYI